MTGKKFEGDLGQLGRGFGRGGRRKSPREREPPSDSDFGEAGREDDGKNHRKDRPRRTFEAQ